MNIRIDPRFLAQVLFWTLVVAAMGAGVIAACCVWQQALKLAESANIPFIVALYAVLASL